MTVDTKQEVAIGIALQTGVLKICPMHDQLYRDDEQFTDEVNVARAFSVAVELVHQHQPYAEQFHHNTHELTDLLSSVIDATPACCEACLSSQQRLENSTKPPKRVKPLLHIQPVAH